MKTEYNEVKEILDRHGITSVDDIGYGDECYDDLITYYMNSGEMPYGIIKARTGMPDEWIADRIIDLDILQETA